MSQRIRARMRLGLAGAALLTLMAGNVLAEGQTTATFSEDIQPMLQIRCVECHQAGAAGLEESGLDLSSYEGVMKGTKHGPVVTPGNAMVSNLLVLVEGKAGIRMPHNKKRLNKCDIENLRAWINQGAKNN